MGDHSTKSKKTPPFLLALGRKPVPHEVQVGPNAYALQQIYKHDFFAATARYAGPAGSVIVKTNRTASMFGLPMRWIGRILARREAAAYQRLADLDAVPRFLGRLGPAAVVHEFIPGHPLRKGERVADDFFDRLRAALAVIHDRGMAYVDLEKCENVLVGDDGRPYLIDFQIAWVWPTNRGGDLWPLSWIRRRLQRADLYHVLKLQRRTRPDQLTEAQLAASYQKPVYIRLHGALTRPFTLLRRRILNRVDPQQKRGERGRIPPCTQSD